MSGSRVSSNACKWNFLLLSSYKRTLLLMIPYVTLMGNVQYQNPPVSFFIFFWYIWPGTHFQPFSIPDILTCNVKPMPKSPPFNEEVAENVPDSVKNFYLVNDVEKFQFDRPSHKGAVDKGNEFKVNFYCICFALMSVSQSPLDTKTPMSCRQCGWREQPWRLRVHCQAS